MWTCIISLFPTFYFNIYSGSRLEWVFVRFFICTQTRRHARVLCALKENSPLKSRRRFTIKFHYGLLLHLILAVPSKKPALLLPSMYHRQVSDLQSRFQCPLRQSALYQAVLAPFLSVSQTESVRPEQLEQRQLLQSRQT